MRECQPSGHVVHDRYNPPQVPGRSFIGHPSKAIQAFKAECDINNVVRNAIRSGMPPVTAGAARSAFFADVSDVDDYQGALAALEAAQAGFMTLPASVRERFGNDPAQLLRHLDTSDNPAEVLNPPATAVPPAVPPADRPSA